ncbi:hypothetical protein M434DRAFT_14504 [Hypoxylon sp. CO27-5]|nr:hypothetical protein M434DRAFT_14504 [Hypoxylon sp. CO27-5]
MVESRKRNGGALKRHRSLTSLALPPFSGERAGPNQLTPPENGTGTARSLGNCAVSLSTPVASVSTANDQAAEGVAADEEGRRGLVTTCNLLLWSVFFHFDPAPNVQRPPLSLSSIRVDSSKADSKFRRTYVSTHIPMAGLQLYLLEILTYVFIGNINVLVDIINVFVGERYSRNPVLSATIVCGMILEPRGGVPPMCTTGS